jgi:hypothetical protein
VRRIILFVAAALLAASSAPVARAAGAGGLEGRWVLAEQTYEKGGTDLAARNKPVHLEVIAGADRVDVRTWQGEIRDARAWPAVPETGVAGATVEVLEKAVDAAAGRLDARFRILPPDGVGLVLDVRESYELGADGASLVGRVVVSMSLDGAPRGGYTLERRFERVAP